MNGDEILVIYGTNDPVMYGTLSCI